MNASGLIAPSLPRPKTGARNPSSAAVEPVVSSAAETTAAPRPGADRLEAPILLRDRQRLAHVKGQTHRLVQAVLEGLNGTRPLQQLSRWVEPRIFRSLQLRRALILGAQSHYGRDHASPYAGAQIHSVHGQLSGPTAVELTVVVRCRKRVRAVAIRMEARNASWIATALEIG
ncbi:Rv3235 family protein [Arthrobacter sp. NPDC090010]|uniref:Rv3235 family protein n=1 Tax=Arthrobacter sp. NPDC090010 TaxID=3363942 RepID=UPI00380A016B